MGYQTSWLARRHEISKLDILYTSARLGIAGGFAKATPTLALASPATALPGAKRPQKPKKPTCLGEALAETEACLPVAAYRREDGSPFS